MKSLEEQIRDARKKVYSITPIRQGGRIVALTFRMEGIVGGGSRRKIFYQIIAMLDDWPEKLPRVFFTYPPDNQIRHKNIYHPHSHPMLKYNLPELCWGGNEDRWSRVPLQRRTILMFLEFLEYVLNNENPRNPAR